MYIHKRAYDAMPVVWLLLSAAGFLLGALIGSWLAFALGMLTSYWYGYIRYCRSVDWSDVQDVQQRKPRWR